MTKFALFSLLSSLLLAPFGLGQKVWIISDDYHIAFHTKGGTGTFRGLEGVVKFDPEDLEHSQFAVFVRTDSISTGNKTKDRHAINDSWLDAANYPRISFTSTEIRPAGNRYMVTGILELHGVEKELSFPFNFTPNDQGGVFEGSFLVSRSTFKIRGAFLARSMVGDEIEVTMKIPVNLAQEP